MPYKQYTHCVGKEEFTGLWSGWMIGGIVTAALGLLAIVLGGGIGAPVLFAGLIMTLEAACGFLLGGKLICLGHNQCAIGKVVQLEPVGFDKPFPEDIDNDYSINILLAPHVEPVTEDTVRNDGGQGRLIAKQPVIDELGLGYAGYPHKNTDLPESDQLYHIPVLHCEFEGGRIDSVCSAGKVAAAFLAVGAALCLIPIIGWLACLLALLIAAAILLGAWFLAHDGNPYDALGDPENGDVDLGQYVIVRGDWTYDAGHADGWNELHPVTFVARIQKVPQFDAAGNPLPPLNPPWQEGKDPAIIANFKNYLNEACEQTHKPYEPEVQDEQRDPRNRWCFHPVVDGCEPEPDDVPIPK